VTRIAIIGWGSLLWDLDNLSPFVKDRWLVNSGPRLPLEFSLVSSKRLGALALAIDHENGNDAPSSTIYSTRNEIAAARADLAARERCHLDGIGFIDRSSSNSHCRSLATLAAIKAWFDQSPIDAAVWTDLAPNFFRRTGQEFSLENAERYLLSLAERPLREAKRYVTNAPGGVDSPLRNLLNQKSWWHAITAL